MTRAPPIGPASPASALSGMESLLERSNLSARQLLIYTGQRLHTDKVLYDAVYAVQWPGLNPELFAAAWRALVEGCDALRTVVEERLGIPYQRVLPTGPEDIECADLRGAPDMGQAVNAWIAERLRQPIVLAEQAFDAVLIRTGEHRYVWFLNIHHIIADAAAVEILIDELYKLYRAGPGARPHLLRFSDHIATEQAHRHSDEYRAAVEYWQRRLGVGVEAPDLYGVQPKTVRQTRVVLRLDAALSANIVTVARSLHDQTTSPHAASANLFTALLSIYLRRVGAGQRIGVGLAYHNRRTERDRNTIGLFMEILPLIMELRADDSLADVVSRVRQHVYEALRHRSYSVPNPVRAPAYVALLNYMRPLRAAPAPLEVHRIHPGYGAHAVSLSVVPPSENDVGGIMGYELWFDINDDVASADSAQRAAGHFLTLLKSALAEPYRSLATLRLIPEQELQALRRLSAGPTLDCAGPGGCLAPFEAQVVRTPAAVAVRYDGGTMSYADLEHRANLLALRLRSLGARRGRFIGIHLERSPEMLIAVLATLKSGAAYVPLDPAYPAARLREMLNDAAPLAILTRTRETMLLPPHAAHILRMDQLNFANGSTPRALRYEITDSDIAYLMYTSGSRGTPKGVLVTHGGVRNYLAWRASYFPLTPDDRCLQKSSLSFDDSVWEILEPLSVGACVVLARPRFEYDSAYLVRLMAEQCITAACFVPSLLRAVTEEPGAEACHMLRRLTTGGETLPIALQRRVHERFPAAALYNGYGTTETTIASSFWRCIDEPQAITVPIGLPIANTEIHLLDATLEPVPLGVPAEICIGGAGLAQGYLNRAALTAERFIEHPLAGTTGIGQRLYRTGDLGRLRADGVLEFFSRIDDQVKVRGVRIELGDIEAALMDHPAVSAAAVVCNEGSGGSKRLIAYVVPRNANAPSSVELRNVLRDRLPSSMIPSRFESLMSLPMTPSGKLDRRALQTISNLVPDEGLPIPPRNEGEARLLALWERVLEVRPIGVQDDFFAIGGDSLTAMRLAGLMNEMIECPMSPEVLFETSTIESLAQRILQQDCAGSEDFSSEDMLVPLASGGSGVPLYLLHQIDGEVARYRELARELSGQRPVYGLRAARLPSGAEPLDRIESMAARYIHALRERQPRGPYALAGHSAGGLIALEMAQLLREAGEEVALLAMLDVDAGMRRRRGAFDAFRYHLEVAGGLPSAHRGTYMWRNLPRLVRAVARRVGRESLQDLDALSSNSLLRAPMERAVRNYRPERYGGHMVVFRARDRTITGTYSRTLGWKPLSRGRLRVIDTPGNHLTMLRVGAVAELAVQLTACLQQADEAAHTARGVACLEDRNPPGTPNAAKVSPMSPV